MDSIFTTTGSGALKARIQNLSAASQPQWGKMNVAQMLAHCATVLKVGLGRHQLPKYNFLLRAIGRMVKKSLLKDDKPFGLNKPTDKTFKITDERNFEAEKAELIKALDEFSEKGKKGETFGDHPFFGKMNNADWDKLQWKHLDHHLRQFSV